MKFIFFILSFNTILAFGQSSNKDSCYVHFDTLTKQEVFRFVDRMPTNRGAMEAVMKEMRKAIRFASIDRDRYPIESRVVIAFIIGVDGSVAGKRVIQNIEGTDIADRLLDAIQTVEWEAGICHGKRVPTLETIPMIIDLK